MACDGSFKNFYFQADYTYSNARMTEEPSGARLYTLAPVNTLLAGLTYKTDRFSAGVHCRWLGKSPANEDYSLTAKGLLHNRYQCLIHNR